MVSLFGGIVLFVWGFVVLFLADWGQGLILIVLAILAVTFGIRELNGWVDYEEVPLSTVTEAAHPVARVSSRRELLGLPVSNTRVPRPVRLAFFVGGLVVLGGTHALTGSAGFQWLALFVLTFGVLPLSARRFGRRDHFAQAVRDRNVPRGVLARAMVFAVVWGGLIVLAGPAVGLGPWFLVWLWVGPWLEVVAFLAERRFERDGGADDWPPFRPLHASALAGVATVPTIAGIALLQDQSVAEALVSGAACGVVVFVIAAVFARPGGRGAAPVEADPDDRPVL